MTNNLEYCNKAIRSFGIDIFFDIFKKVNQKYNLPIISVGSGNGAFEKIINDKLNLNIVCIDPDPLKYNSNSITKPFIVPQYKYVDDIIPFYKDNCILLLNWCDPNDSNYDYDAIIKLNPVCIISVYEVFNNDYGAAGGKKFFDYIYNNNEYNILNEISIYEDENQNNLDLRIIILEKKDKLLLNKFNEKEKFDLPEYLPCLIRNEMCNIM